MKKKNNPSDVKDYAYKAVVKIRDQVVGTLREGLESPFETVEADRITVDIDAMRDLFERGESITEERDIARVESLPENGWAQVGEVGVDSGQLCVMDPCYVGTFTTGEDLKVAVKYWGRDEKEVEAEFGPSPIKAHPEEIDALEQRIRDHCWENDLIVCTQQLDASPRSKSVHQALKHEIGSAEFAFGIDGLATVIQTYSGDGHYPVMARFKNGRVAEFKVLLDLGEDEEDYDGCI